MSAVWVVPILFGVVVISVVGVLDSFLHLADRRIREQADALAELADDAEALASTRLVAEGRAGSETRAPRH